VQRLDPSYFEFVADAYAAQQGEPNPPGGDDAAAVPMHAALALRTAYVHAAETLLALLLRARQDTTSKYNSIKHGLRTDAGGFRLAMGVEDRPGERAAPARMRSFGGSRYGSSYCELRPIGSREPSAGVQRRLRLALQVADAIARVDGNEVSRAWFQGLNPQLSDRSPARLLREGDLDEVGPEVVGAARAFLAGG
jgi:hypothetical protein